MSVTSVVGLQWGDEGKGKLSDILTPDCDIVVRYQGGNNAGHTVCFGGETYKLSLLPAGILHPGVAAVVGPGVVLNLKAIFSELDEVERRNGPIDGGLIISDRAHVIFPYHMAEEAALEKSRKDNAIGTTMRGIGTCYRDKAGRTHAIRVCDLLHQESFEQRLREIVAHKNIVLKALDPDFEPLDADAIYEEYCGYAERLRSHATNTTAYLHKALAAGKSIVFEGAQGCLLDIDHGTFPFVTSSNAGTGVHNGSGVPERVIDRMIGIVKAYTTRVGGGPFPSELLGDVGQRIRDEGQEYGTVTGRPRRCGWFDAVAAGYGARLSGVDSLAITKLDVLSGLEEPKICDAYEIDGERTTDFPSHIESVAKAIPVYKTMPGWKGDITGARAMSELPEEARRYLDAMSELLGTPIGFVSVGPDREETIVPG